MDAKPAARLLLDARAERTRIGDLPAPARPASDADSYAIQDLVIRELGPIGGWKVGARTPESEPNCAPLPASLVFRSPHVFAGQFPLCIVEAEVGFTIARDLPPRSTPYAERDVLAALASVHATIELLDTRLAGYPAVDPATNLADFGANGALVAGPPRTHDLRVDQPSLHLAVHCNGERVLEKTGGNTAGDVFRLLVWLANHAAARTGGLRAGQVVTTGSCIGAYKVAPGTHVRAVFDGIPPVEATL
jgi:2-keto-4-pentenoate hydratase